MAPLTTTLSVMCMSLLGLTGTYADTQKANVPVALQGSEGAQVSLGGALLMLLLSPVAIIVMVRTCTPMLAPAASQRNLTRRSRCVLQMVITNADLFDKIPLKDKEQRKVKFHSRFAHMLTENAPSTYFVSLFAMLAESVGHVFMPDFGYLYHIDLSLTFVNLTGVFMGGIAAQYQAALLNDDSFIHS